MLLSETILLLDSLDWHEQYLSLAILKASVILECNSLCKETDKKYSKQKSNPDFFPKKQTEKVFKSTRSLKVVSLLPARTSAETSNADSGEILNEKNKMKGDKNEKQDIDNDSLNGKKSSGILVITLCRSGAVRTLCALLTHQKSYVRDLVVEVIEDRFFYVYRDVYIYIYNYMKLYVYTFTYICIFVHFHIHVYMSLNFCVYIK